MTTELHPWEILTAAIKDLATAIDTLKHFPSAENPAKNAIPQFTSRKISLDESDLKILVECIA